MIKKVLFAANLESFFTKFLIPQLKYFKEQGYEVHIACGLEGLDIPYCDKEFNVNFARSLNVKQNLESYKQMREILKNEKYGSSLLKSLSNDFIFKSINSKYIIHFNF